MVVVYYQSLVTGMKAAANMKNLQPPPYKADLSVNILAYNLTGFLSVAAAGLMLLEQYAMRRVYCIGDGSPATSEYCWHHGFFARNNTNTEDQSFIISIQDSWILQIYMYFFIRAFFFIAPHLLWVLKFKDKIVALLQGTCDIINDLEKSWVRYAESAEEEISKAKMIELGVNEGPQSKETVQRNLVMQYSANVAMTRSVKEMTTARMQDYRPMLRFTGLRMTYDIIVHTVFLLMDVAILLKCYQFDGTDFYCHTTWNDQDLHCMLPMMQMMQQVMLLSFLCSGFMWLVMFVHTIWLAVYLLKTNTSECFLELIPYITKVEWDSAIDRRTYKLMSLYLLQNFVILHPLDLLKTFIKSLERKGVAGKVFIETILQQEVPREEPGAAGDQKSAYRPQLSLWDNNDSPEKVWLQLKESKA